MVTSQDLGTVNPPYYYPMNATIGSRSSDGLNWSYPSTVMNESLLNSGTYRAGQANHLWAPSVRFFDYGSGPESTRFESRLYVPALTDLTSPFDQLSSKIYVARRYGTAQGTLWPFGKVTGGTGAELNAYMSDPEVFSDTATPLADSSKDYLVWANGDNSTCGDISIRKMTGATTLQAYTTKSQHQIVINGDEVLGNCTGGSTNPHPYLEGATLYRLGDFKYAQNNAVPGPYTLVFAAKPTSAVPEECKAPGQPNTDWGGPGSDYEVLAYATSTTVTGPYTYKGIIMCGSSTEWTNQGTIMEVKTQAGSYRLVLVYHDGPAGANNRSLRSECLFTDNRNGGAFINTQRSPEGAITTGAQRQWCLDSSHGTSVIALKAPNGRYVTSGYGSLYVSAAVIGPWEQFGLNGNRPTNAWLHARHENLWVQANQNNGGALVAAGASAGPWEGLVIEYATGNNIRIKSYYSGKYVRLDAGGNLIADTTQANATLFVITTLAAQ